MRRMRGLGHEGGQTATEFVGVLALVALVVAVLTASSIAPVFRAASSETTCAVLDDPGCAPPGALPERLRDAPADGLDGPAAPAAAALPGASSSRVPGDPETAERNLLDNVAGFFRGAVSQVGEMVTGVVDLAGWGLRSLTSHDQRVENGLLWQQLRDHPGESLRAMLAGVVEPIVAEWRAGRPGAAVGRGGVEVASLFLGTHGLDKLRALALANRLDTAADSTGVLARLRAVDWSDETGAISLGRRLPSRTDKVAKEA